MVTGSSSTGPAAACSTPAPRPQHVTRSSVAAGEPHRHKPPSRSQPHPPSSSIAPAPSNCRTRYSQIDIDPAAPPRIRFPRFLPLEVFGRRPPCHAEIRRRKMNRRCRSDQGRAFCPAGRSVAGWTARHHRSDGGGEARAKAAAGRCRMAAAWASERPSFLGSRRSPDLFGAGVSFSALKRWDSSHGSRGDALLDSDDLVLERRFAVPEAV